jgi:hypothetical protein
MAKPRLQMPPCPHDRNTRTRYANEKLTISARDTVSVCITAERAAHVERSCLDLSMVNPGGWSQTSQVAGLRTRAPATRRFFSRRSIFPAIWHDFEG